MGEEVALEFAADVTEAVASVRELAATAQDLAGAAKEAADGCASITAPAGEAATATKELADSSTAAAAGAGEVAAGADKAAESLGIYIDAAGRARLANGQFATSAQMAAAGTTEAAAKADAAAAGGLGRYKMALLGIGIGTAVAVDAAGKFQDQTTHLVTDAGESASQLAMVQQGILKVSAATGTAASQITDGMYHVESAGYHGAQGLALLQTAAEGAKVGGAQLNDVAFALVGSMNAYYGSTMTASQATQRSTAMMNELIATTSAGDLKMQDLSTSLHSMSPVAAAAHVSFAQIGGALATMTAQGMSAQQGAQDIGHTLGQLVNPAKTATKEMALMGVSASDVATHLGQRGLTGTLAMLSQAAKEHAGAAGQTYAAAMSKMLNGTVGLNTSLMLTGSHLSDFQKNVATVQAAADKGGTSVDNWGKIQSTFNFKLEQAKTATEDAGIALGSALLPAVTAVLGPLAQFLAFIAGNRTAAIAFAVVVGGILAGALGLKLAGALKDAKEGIQAVGEGASWLVGKIVAMTTAQEAQTVATEAATVAQGELDVAMDANPIGLIIIAVAALIAVVVLLVMHWKTVWHAITSVVDDAVGFITSHWKLLGTILLTALLGPMGLLIAFIATHFDQVKKIIGDVISWVAAHWKEIVAWLVDPIGMAVHEILTHTHDIAKAFDTMRHDVAAVLDGARHDVSAGFDAVRHAVAAFADWVPGAVSRAWQLAVHAQLAMLDAARHDVAVAFDAVRHAVSSGVDDVVRFFQQLPGKVTAQLARLPGDMLAIGRNVITGLINGIVSSAEAIPGIMSGLASDVASYFTNPLKLFSPSRLFFDHGFNIVQGAINGVKANAPALLATMRGLGTNVGVQGTGSSLAAGAVAPAGGGTSVHVTVPVTIQGSAAGAQSPEYLQGLQAAVQEAVLRYGQLNPDNGLTSAWGR